jgi:carbamoyl-phosphate synthase small subunit
MDALLVLEDGRAFHGRSIGAPGETTGELVFTTGMTGYQEILTDPSYSGQLVVMTAPHIGNTGVNPIDPEAERPCAAGLLVRAYSDVYSSWRAQTSLAQYLREHGIVALAEIDTRALTRHIRAHGSLRAVISTERADVAELQRRACAAPQMEGLDLASRHSTQHAYSWEQSSGVWADPRPAASALHVVAYDFGLKRNILRRLVDHGARVTVVPAATPAASVLALKPDGVFFSNGPGDPATLGYAVENVRALLGKAPIFGICLGHQLMGLAVGGQTYKLPFGHHGCNHPVQHLATRRVQITSQNHGFAVAAESLPDDVVVTHRNLNDGTVEGLRHTRYPAFSVQYHPEAAPGPHDADPLFSEFVQLMRAA